MKTRQMAGMLALAATSLGCGAGKYRELDTLETLKTAFNADRGKVRIVLLLSPT